MPIVFVNGLEFTQSQENQHVPVTFSLLWFSNVDDMQNRRYNKAEIKIDSMAIPTEGKNVDVPMPPAANRSYLWVGISPDGLRDEKDDVLYGNDGQQITFHFYNYQATQVSDTPQPTEYPAGGLPQPQPLVLTEPAVDSTPPAGTVTTVSTVAATASATQQQIEAAPPQSVPEPAETPKENPTPTAPVQPKSLLNIIWDYLRGLFS